MKPIISVVLPTFNRANYLPFVLHSLKNQTFAKNMFEVIFVNNNSTDSTGEIALNFKNENSDINFRYLEEPTLGVSYARNAGVNASLGNYITFAEDDAYLDMNFLSRLFDFFQTHEDVIAVGGRIFVSYTHSSPKWVTPFLASLLGRFDLGEDQKLFPSNNYPRGANMAFRKEAFEKHGMFSISLGRIGRSLEGGEEKDIFVRIRNAKEKIFYLPQLIAFHFVPNERTKIEFIRRQAKGVGKSEAIRVKNMGIKTTLFRIIEEIYKWGASFILLISYLIKLMPVKGITLIKFRYWVTTSFVSNL